MKKSERVKLAMRVRMYRDHYNLSQREFGELFGVHQISDSLVEKVGSLVFEGSEYGFIGSDRAIILTEETGSRQGRDKMVKVGGA